MTSLVFLKAATSLSDVARLLGMLPSHLAYTLYLSPPAAKYTTFAIPKRSGGTRTISAPTKTLKFAQRNLATLLQDCEAEINEQHKFKDELAHGFKRGKSIVSNARMHRHRRYVFNVDLQDFFGTINFGRVRGYFVANRDFQLHPKVATVLAQIACHNNALPQGSPCSPVVANLIGHLLDVRLAELARDAGCRYTRYADDITFSTNEKVFPGSIALLPPGSDQWAAGPALTSTVLRSGFVLNAAKTRMQYRAARQEVTGLVVNSKVNVRSEYRHSVRAMVDRLVRTGGFEHWATVLTPSGASEHKKVPGSLDTLNGMLGFIDSIDRFNDRIHDRKLDTDDGKLSSKEKLYRRFLLYKEFYAAPRPVILFEGKTDYVYLLHAIRSLAAANPKLATVAAGKITLVPRLFKYKKGGASRVLGLGGGTADLKKVMDRYRRESGRFAGPGLLHPVIVLIDNDEGKKPVCSFIKELSGKSPTGMEVFIHVFKNLYVVMTPKASPSDQTAIEDGFDAATLATVLSGRSLSLSNDYDKTTHYGKTEFAREVIAKGATTINFAGFQPLLDRITAVIDEHAKKVAAAAAVASIAP